MKIKQLLLLILILNTARLSAQIFDVSQARYDVRWKQIKTDQFRLIFPVEFNNAAPTLAANLEDFIKKTSSDLNRKPRFINIIVQENHLLQNGFVQLAPRKSELYATPSAIADNQEWLPNLALHESRHIAQFDNLTGKIRAPFGEQIALALFGLNLPAWYFEGDAVLQETLFSNGGRGRLSSWQMPIRANIQSGINYDFNKYVHGSFKDIVPSFYTIGYFMNSELYEKDSQIHSKILEEMNGKLLRPFNFQQSLRKHFGLKASDIFNLTMVNLKQKWSKKTVSEQDISNTFSEKYPTHYLLPQTNNTGLFALEEGPQRTSRIVQIDTTGSFKKHQILRLGMQIMPYFHLRNNLITWDEYRKDARFEKQSYNVIMLYDLVTNKRKTLSKNSRYYTPVIAPNRKEIACVHISNGNKTALTILDIESAKIKDSISFPDGTNFQQPQYNTAGNLIIGIAVSKEGTNLALVDLDKKTSSLLLQWSNVQIEHPIFDGNSIVYKANYNNKDDIFRLENGIITQITDSRFGAFNPTLKDSILLYNDYTINGYKISQKNTSKIQQRIITPEHIEALYSKQNLTQSLSLDSTQIKEYEIKNYNTLKNSFNFHSISLSGSDFESFDNLKPGIFWLSNDIMNTTFLKFGYEFDTEIQKSSYSASLSYQKYFPKLTISYSDKGQIGAAKASNGSSIEFDWRERLASLDISLPFSTYRENFVYAYGVNFGTSYLSRYNVSIPNLQNFNYEVAFPLNYQIYFNKNTRKADMDITPRWGQNFSITYRHIPFENNLTGNSWSLRTNFYFPGIRINHGLQIRYAMQSNTGRYTYIQDIPLITGFSHIPYQIVKNTFLLDYRFPLMYPDLSVGQFAYIKRVRARLSAHYQNIHNASIVPKSNSLGFDFDFNLFKYTLPLFTASITTTYINDASTRNKLFPTFGFSYSY